MRLTVQAIVCMQCACEQKSSRIFAINVYIWMEMSNLKKKKHCITAVEHGMWCVHQDDIKIVQQKNFHVTFTARNYVCVCLNQSAVLYCLLFLRLQALFSWFRGPSICIPELCTSLIYYVIIIDVRICLPETNLVTEKNESMREFVNRNENNHTMLMPIVWK